MNSVLIAAFLAGITPEAATRQPPPCLGELGAAETILRLSDLPEHIRSDLMAFTENEIVEADQPLLQTDAPSAAERNHAEGRFAQAARFRDRWFVQFEVAMAGGVRTVTYVRHGDGLYYRSPGYYFNGPACASIRAALEGVTTPGGF